MTARSTWSHEPTRIPELLGLAPVAAAAPKAAVTTGDVLTPNQARQKLALPAKEAVSEMKRANFIGAPEYFNLNAACHVIAEAYGHCLYLVGSALTTREHRDVDLRAILDDDEFDQMFPGLGGRGAEWADARWSLLCASISEWIASRTGLQGRLPVSASHPGEREVRLEGRSLPICDRPVPDAGPAWNTGMRLVDLEPAWLHHVAADGTRRDGVGLTLRCMTGHCHGRLWIQFANPLDGGPALAQNMLQDVRQSAVRSDDPNEWERIRDDRDCGPHRWERTGETFETLSMRPSVDAHECGHFTLTDGEWR